MNTSRFHSGKLHKIFNCLTVIILSGSICISVSVGQIIDKKQQYNTIYLNTGVDSLASFPGGAEKLFSYIADHFHVDNEMQRE